MCIWKPSAFYICLKHQAENMQRKTYRFPSYQLCGQCAVQDQNCIGKYVLQTKHFTVVSIAINENKINSIVLVKDMPCVTQYIYKNVSKAQRELVKRQIHVVVVLVKDMPCVTQYIYKNVSKAQRELVKREIHVVVVLVKDMPCVTQYIYKNVSKAQRELVKRQIHVVVVLLFFWSHCPL